MIRMPPRPGKALEEAVSLWLEVGSLAPLEHAVFAGYGQLLEGRTSRIPKVNAFLKKVPQYQARQIVQIIGFNLNFIFSLHGERSFN
jgi:hypothetical protein